MAACTSGEASTISSASTPASGQPVMLRVTSPQAPSVVMPVRQSVSSTVGRSSIVTQWSWTFWRTVRSAMPRAYRSARSAIARTWCAASDAVRDADAHHEVRRRLALAAFPADRADAVALRVDAPPAEVRPSHSGGMEAWPSRAKRRISSKASHGIHLALEPLDPLRLGLLDCLAHGLASLKTRKPEADDSALRLRLAIATFALRSRLPDVPQRDVYPAFTSGAFRRDSPGRRIDPHDGVPDDDLLGGAQDEGDPADRAPASLDCAHDG